jgi:hypothetical protein
MGLRYERRIGKELHRHIGQDKFIKIEHNPWLTYRDSFGPGNCCPDYLVWHNDYIIIVEVKLSWVEVAVEKLNALYTPVVAAAFGLMTTPLVICRNVTSESPPASHTVSAALSSPYHLLQWPNNGHLLW